jgi:hypothetical protein
MGRPGRSGPSRAKARTSKRRRLHELDSGSRPAPGRRSADLAGHVLIFNLGPG